MVTSLVSRRARQLPSSQQAPSVSVPQGIVQVPVIFAPSRDCRDFDLVGGISGTKVELRGEPKLVSDSSNPRRDGPTLHARVALEPKYHPSGSGRSLQLIDA